jgi:Cobinamide kinase / cobinamide phosphate guanyltransferase
MLRWKPALRATGLTGRTITGAQWRSPWACPWSLRARQAPGQCCLSTASPSGSNLMLGGRDVAAMQSALLQVLHAAKGPVLLVSNEVGMGLVPETQLGRDFRDAQGRLNQAVAEMAGHVVFVVAGVPLVLKRP